MRTRYFHRLKQGATTFGRGATADVYIDSLELKNFISRRHAVIVGERDEDGQLQFILHNHGLNGTYVNDVRVSCVMIMKWCDMHLVLGPCLYDVNLQSVMFSRLVGRLAGHLAS